MSLRTLKWAAILCFFVAMAILLGGGVYMKKDLPPYPGEVVGPGAEVLFQKSDIMAGQNVYQRYGLMDHGAVWGHGSQRGPEFSAHTLHIMAESTWDNSLDPDKQAAPVETAIPSESRIRSRDSPSAFLKFTLEIFGSLFSV